METLARALGDSTGLQVTHPGADGAPHSCIGIPFLGESLFDIERAGGELTVYSHIPAHPYLWENLNRVVETQGGQRLPDDTHWRPDHRFRHARKPWAELGARQKWLLRFPAIGASRLLDRFV